MKKLISFSFLIIFMISQVFCHEQTKQKMTINPDPLTEKWIKCENSSPEEYQKNLEEFLIEVENSKPDKTILYYFPEVEKLYNDIYLYTKELVTPPDTINSVHIENLRNQINNSILDWEILQKNLTQFKLEQVNYSYVILIFVIVISILMAFVFFVMYLISSKLRKESSAFTRQMIQTQEAERERISNDLHDTVCQDLRVLQFMLKDEESVTLCKKITTDVRNTCYALTPSDLKEGIFDSLISLCSLCKEKSDINVILSVQDDIKQNPVFKNFSKEKNLNIYRIIQEIITNALKHAEAENISVLLRSFDENNFKIIVSDDGKGFDLSSSLKKKNHFGLKNIQTRAENLGGKISLSSEIGEGTQITLIVPYL